MIVLFQMFVMSGMDAALILKHPRKFGSVLQILFHNSDLYDS